MKWGDWGWGARADVNFASRFYASTGEGNPQSLVAGNALLGSRIAAHAPGERWIVTLSGDNLTDKGYFRLKFVQPFDAVLGVRVLASGATVSRDFTGAPAAYRMRVGFTSRV